MSSMSSPGLGDIQGDNTGALLLANSAGVQQRLASLVQQLAGLQQDAVHQQQHSLLGYGSMAAAHSTCHMQDSLDPLGTMGRPAASVGAVLRSLSTRNPRVLALAAAAAKAPPGTPQHAAVLSALKDEIMQATQPATGFAAHDAGAADNSPAFEDSMVTEHAGLEQQPLTQDALWAALMAKAAARSGANPCASNPSSRNTQQQQQAVSPKALACHGSMDSEKETENTSCSLPWALLQAAQQAQQEEEEKEAAAAAAQAAADAAAAAAEAQAATDAAAAQAALDVAAAAAAPAAQPTAMSVDPPEDSRPGSPHKSSSLPRVGSQVVFKRRSTPNCNALQKHFGSKQPQQRHAPGPLARTQSDAAGIPKPMYTFKKQARKQTLVLRGNSSGNLAALQQANRQEGANASPSVQPAAEQPECSAESGGAPAAASYMSADNHSGSLSGGSMRAPAITAPAALGNSNATDVLSFLASRERQLHALQELLQLYRPKMQPPAGVAAPGSCSTLAGYLGARAPCQSTSQAAAFSSVPTDINSTAAAIGELQRLLNSRGIGVVSSDSAAAAAAAAACSSMPDQMETDMFSCGTQPSDHVSGAAAAAMLAQAAHRASQQQQQQLQQQQQAYEPGSAASGSMHNLATLRALASALADRQQQQQQAPLVAGGLSGRGLSGVLSGANAELLRKLAAAMQPMV